MREGRNRAVQLRRFGGPDGLDVVDVPLPTAGRGEVRIRVLASSCSWGRTAKPSSIASPVWVPSAR
jgi:hypothetical protein